VEYPWIDGRIILEWILWKMVGRCGQDAFSPGRYHAEYLGVDGKLILEWIRTTCGILWARWWTFGFRKGRECDYPRDCNLSKKDSDPLV
jgi:hypothetical protein